MPKDKVCWSETISNFSFRFSNSYLRQISDYISISVLIKSNIAFIRPFFSALCPSRVRTSFVLKEEKYCFTHLRRSPCEVFETRFARQDPHRSKIFTPPLWPKFTNCENFFCSEGIKYSRVQKSIEN